LTYPSDIKPLTGLRFIAAFWLLLYFFWGRLELGGRTEYGLIEKGYLGVDLFFILSGFVLAHVYGPQVEARTYNWRSFVWARIARIYPLHILTLLSMIGLWAAAKLMGSPLQEDAFVVEQIPAHLLLVHAWGILGSDGWNFPSWSISAEWFAYLLFPLFFGLMSLFRKAPLAGVGFAAGLFLVLFAITNAMGFVLTNMTWQGGIVRIVPSFLAGIGLWMLGRKLESTPLSALLGVLISVAWIVVASSMKFPAEFVWPGLMGLVFFVAETSKHENSAIFADKRWVYLGEISFAAYMVHLPVDIIYYQVVERVFGAPSGLAAIGLGAGAIGLTLVCAALAHGIVEKPARDWLRANTPDFIKAKPVARTV
jgi:peptidoglycan/LPS O-acetylase OafA/YrhL